MPHAFKTLFQREFKVCNCNLFSFVIFLRWVSLCSLCWPGTYCVDQLSLKLVGQLILLPQPLSDNKLLISNQNMSEDRCYLDSWMSSGLQAWQQAPWPPRPWHVSSNSVSSGPSKHHPVGMESHSTDYSLWDSWLHGFGKGDGESGGLELASWLNALWYGGQAPSVILTSDVEE